MHVATAYLIAAATFIALAELALVALWPGSATSHPATLIKYAVFVALTAGVLYLFVDRRDAQRAGILADLRRSDDAFAKLFAASPHAIAVTDPTTGEYLEVNEALAVALGMPRADIIGRTSLELGIWLHPAQRACTVDEMRKKGRLRNFEARLNMRNALRDCLLSAEQVEFHGGPAILWHFVDLTEQRQADAAARDAALRLKTAVEAGNIGLWDWDLRTDKVFYSREWKSQIGYAEHEIGDTAEEWRSHLHQDDREHTLRAVEAYMQNPVGDFRVEFRFRHKDGSYRWILAQGALLHDDAGKPMRMLGSHTDITERKRMEDQLVQATKMEAIGQLTGGMAHDFNNLLGVVIGNLDLLGAHVSNDPAAAELAGDALRGALRGAELVKRLLAFSRRQSLEPKVLAMGEVIDGIVPLLRRTLGEHIEISATAAAGLWPVYADPVQLESAIVNLAVNARDAMPQGGQLTIETANVELDEQYAQQHMSVASGEYVMLAVSDSGVGMTPEVQARLFEPFFTTKAPGQGTGLGLATCYGIVKQHGGQIWVYSEVGHGTTVKVYLPRSTEVEESRMSAEPAATRGGAETVLLVEDDSGVRVLAARVLRQLGYTVLEAKDGGEALRVAAAHEGRVDLLLTDVVMPQLSGSELAAQLLGQDPELKIIYTSGYTEDRVVQDSWAEVGVAFLSKPFSGVELAQIVRTTLDGTG